MKLYLTATSERGKPVTKSGNEVINIKLSHNRDIIYSLTFQDGYIRLTDFTNGKILHAQKYSTACPHGNAREVCATCKWNDTHKDN